MCPRVFGGRFCTIGQVLIEEGKPIYQERDKLRKWRMGNHVVCNKSSVSSTKLLRRNDNLSGKLVVNSHNYRRVITMALVIFAVLGLAVVPDAEAEVIAYFSMDTDPGWSTQGQWAWGRPLGYGSYCGDPSSGHTGLNVYGYNLAGDYNNYMPQYHLTTTVLDCSVFENVKLSFWRWLGVEAAFFDQAKIEVSNDGTWPGTELWKHTGDGFCDGTWIERVYDISAVADNQNTVYIRWTMGPTDGSITYPGWNIDDVLLDGDRIDYLSIEPPEGFASSGNQGGTPEPFTPSSKDYTLTNTSTAPLDWAVEPNVVWLDAEPNSGTLPAGTNTTVTVYINAHVNDLDPNIYTATIAFSNLTSGFDQTRDTTLTVRPAPGEIEVTDSIPPVDDNQMPFGDVIVGLSRTEQVTIANIDPIHDLVVMDISLGPGYFEDFNDGVAQHWQPLVPPYWEVVSGEYRAAAHTTDVRMQSLYMGKFLQDCAAQVTMRRTGFRYSATVLLVRASDDFIWGTTGSAYLIGIEGSGYYYVVKYVSGVIHWLQEWAYSPYLNAGERSNVVTVNREETTIDVYFNGNLAWSGIDNSLMSGGRIGLLAYSGVNFETIHYFDDVLISKPLANSQTISAEQQWYNEHPCEGGTLQAAPADWTPPEYPLQCGVSLPVRPTGLIKPVEGFQLENVPRLPLTIPPLDSNTFDVRFTPSAYKDYQSTSVIRSNDKDEYVVELQLSGTGILEYLEIIPDEDFEFSGHPGGPFVPSNKSYQLTNNGPVNIDWNVEPNVPWLDVYPPAGTLKPAQSTTVMVVPNAEVLTMPQGYYCGYLTFTDITTTVRQIRKICLNVYTEPKIWASPFSFNVTVPQGGAQTQILTIGNTGDSALDFTLSSQQTNFTPPPEQAPAGAVSAPAGHDFTMLADVPFAEGELLVRFAPQAGAAKPNIGRRNMTLGNLGGATVQREYKIVPGLCLVKLPAGITTHQALVSFNNAAGILYAEPNYKVKLTSDCQNIPNDTSFNLQWNMHNTGQMPPGGTPDADIDAPEAWCLNTDCSNIIVAVIDTGVDYTHPDLAENMWLNEAELNGTPGVDDDGNGYVDDIYGYDFCTYGQIRDSDPLDDNGHGSHTSGIIGAVGDNGKGVAGVCWNVKIMALKFLDYTGVGYISDAIDCVEYSILMGADLMNNSWGGGSYNQSLRDAIAAAGEAGMLFVVSAGNGYGNDNDTNPHYPSSYDPANVISVMSTDCYDNVPAYSSYGPTSVDLGAPGGASSCKVYSCWKNGEYYYAYGTSMAAPHVTAACAIIWSVCPSLTHLDVKDIILETVDPLPSLEGLCLSGGRLNLYNAIIETKASCGAPWLDFVPNVGTVPPSDADDVIVIFNAEQNLGTYQGHIIISSNDSYTPDMTVPVTMTIEPVDYFTELFDPDYFDPNDPNYNDTANRTLTFRPDALGSYYRLCSNAASAFPVDPNGGTIISLRDDDYMPVNLHGAHVNFYGNNYDTFYIGSNGYITFISGDIRYFESLTDHFDLPRISALFDDLDLSAGGSVSWKQLDDRVVVTFENVPEYNLSNSNSFQSEMCFNGKIRITLLDIAAHDGLVGLSEGNGLSHYFIESDLSQYGLCTFVGDLNGDKNVDLADFAILAEYWQYQKYKDKPKDKPKAKDKYPWCEECDFNQDFRIDFDDLLIFCEHWLE